MKQEYTGTRWLSLAVVLGVALGTLIGKGMDNMRTGLMIGLILALAVWVVLQKRQKPAGQETPQTGEAEETPHDE